MAAILPSPTATNSEESAPGVWLKSRLKTRVKDFNRYYNLSMCRIHVIANNRLIVFLIYMVHETFSAFNHMAKFSCLRNRFKDPVTIP